MLVPLIVASCGREETTANVELPPSAEPTVTSEVPHEEPFSTEPDTLDTEFEVTSPSVLTTIEGSAPSATTTTTEPITAVPDEEVDAQEPMPSAAIIEPQEDMPSATSIDEQSYQQQEANILENVSDDVYNLFYDARLFLANRLAVDRNIDLEKYRELEIYLMDYGAEIWPDSSLGCYQIGWLYEDVEISGYWFEFAYETKKHRVHVDDARSTFVWVRECLEEPQRQIVDTSDIEPRLTTDVPMASGGRILFTLYLSGFEPGSTVWTLRCSLSSDVTIDTPEDELSDAMNMSVDDCDLSTSQAVIVNSDGTATLKRWAYLDSNFMWKAVNDDQSQISTTAVFLDTW